MNGLEALRTLARGRVHGGYRWAVIFSDGALGCETCTRKEYRRMFESTRWPSNDGWRVVGLTHSGESEETEHCAHCGKLLWEAEE